MEVVQHFGVPLLRRSHEIVGVYKINNPEAKEAFNGSLKSLKGHIRRYDFPCVTNAPVGLRYFHLCVLLVYS